MKGKAARGAFQATLCKREPLPDTAGALLRQAPVSIQNKSADNGKERAENPLFCLP